MLSLLVYDILTHQWYTPKDFIVTFVAVPHNICEILLYNRHVVIMIYELIYVVRAARR